VTYRVLLSCASAVVNLDLFEPGEYTIDEARERAGRIKSASPGVEAYVVPAGVDPHAFLHERGWI